MMKIQTGRQAITLSVLIAIYSISMVTSLPGLAISPILGKLEDIFKNTSEFQLQMLESLPSFIIVPFILLAGRLSLRFNKKKILIIGLSMFFVCSTIYPFAQNMALLLWISAMLGIGAGMVIPFSTGLVADYFTGQYRIKQLGYVSAITNLTLVLATLLSGFLAGVNWHFSFLVYCLSGVSLFFAFFLDSKSPYEKEQSATTPQNNAGHFRLKWPLGLMSFYYVVTLLVLTIPLNLALYMQNLHLGNYDTSGTLISVFFLAITAPGIFINKVIKTFKEYTNFISMAMISLGLILFAFKSGMILLTIGVILMGLGYGTIQPIIYDKTAGGVAPSHATYALALVMSMNYIAIITYPFILELLGKVFTNNSAYFPFIFCMIVSAVLTVFTFFRRHTKALD